MCFYRRFFHAQNFLLLCVTLPTVLATNNVDDHDFNDRGSNNVQRSSCSLDERWLIDRLCLDEINTDLLFLCLGVHLFGVGKSTAFDISSILITLETTRRRDHSLQNLFRFFTPIIVHLIIVPLVHVA